MRRSIAPSFGGAVVFSVLAVALSTACDPLPSNADLASSGQYCNMNLGSQVNGQELPVESSNLQSSALAQSFQVSAQTNVNSIMLRLENQAGGTIAGNTNVEVAIESDANGSPSGLEVGSAETSIPVSAIASGFNNYTLYFQSETTLATSTNYWVVLTQNAAVQNAIYWAAVGQTAGNSMYYSDAEGWQPISTGLGTRSFLFGLGCN